MATTVASVTTREIQEIDSPFNDYFMQVDIPDAYRVDAKSFIERPFFVDEVIFPDTAARYTLLTSTVRFLPGDIARSNQSVLNMFKMAAYGRPDLIINVSMAGTITHAGCVLVGVLPPFPAYPTLVSTDNKRLINTILTGPHAFLHANEATSVAIPVPWYCNTDLATTDMELKTGYDNTLDITVVNGNYATLVFLVLNPLAPSTGSTKSLRIIVEACFKNFDLAVPTPRFVTWAAQAGRSMFNPTYEDFDRIAREYGLEAWVTAPVSRKKRIFNRVAKFAPLVGGAVSIVGILVRIAFMALVGEDPLPMDFIPTPPEAFDFGPQSGIVGQAMGMVTSIFDSAASGLKQVANDAIDSGRGLVREYTGLHNPNVPQVNERVIMTHTNFVNNTDCPQFFEKLDPYVKFNRLVKEPIFGSDVDEMAISNIITKKQLIGTIKVTTEDGVGALKWVRPISPFQGGSGTPTASDGVLCFNNLELLHAMSRGWRGPMKLTIQSVMNNKQQCKLKVIKMYNPSVTATTKYPVYKSVVNAPTHLLEFTEGGQEHIVDLPYLCRNDITPCASNMDAEALFHGMYYIYVAQPLVISDSSPNNIEFNIFLQGEPTLSFYGYTTATTYHDSFQIIPSPGKSDAIGAVNTLTSVTSFTPNIAFYKHADNKDFTLYSIFLNTTKNKTYAVDKTKWSNEQKAQFEKFVNDNDEMYKIIYDNWKEVKSAIDDDAVFSRVIKRWKYDSSHKCERVDLSSLTTAQVLRLKKVMKAEERRVFHPQTSSGGSIRVMNEPQKQSHTTRVDDKEQNIGHMTRLMPTLDIRHFVRRMYKSQVYSAGLEPMQTVNTVLPLSTFLGEDPSNWNYTPIETFSRMYYGKSVGFKFRCMVTLIESSSETIPDVDFLNLRVYYVPQNINTIVTDKTITSALPNVNAILSPYAPSDGVPLPFQILGKESTSTHVVYEFVVPDTSFYKFMGGPAKFYDFSGSSSVNPVAQADFGSLILQFTNVHGKFPGKYTFELFVGLTDESRFGYHSIAPPFVVYKTGSTYLGTDTSFDATVSPTLNPYVYKGGFL